MNQLKNTLEKILNPLLLLTLAALLIIAALFFEFSPVVKEARLFISDYDLYEWEPDCFNVLARRPWYGQFNPWDYVWYLVPPLVIFSLKPRAHWLLHFFFTLSLGLFCWYAKVREKVLYWEIRNDIFYGIQFTLDKSEWATECINIADGASLAFALFFGLPWSFYYVGLWLMLWMKYHRFLDKDAVFFLDYLSNCILFCVRFWIVLLVFLVLIIDLIIRN